MYTTAKQFTTDSIIVSDIYTQDMSHRMQREGISPYLFISWLGLARLFKATQRAHLSATQNTHRQGTDGQSNDGHYHLPRVRSTEPSVRPKVLGKLVSKVRSRGDASKLHLDPISVWGHNLLRQVRGKTAENHFWQVVCGENHFLVLELAYKRGLGELKIAGYAERVSEITISRTRSHPDTYPGSYPGDLPVAAIGLQLA
jgi:hypothetical protein